MGIKNKIRPKPTNATFSVKKEMLYSFGAIGRSTSKKRNGPTVQQTALATLETFADLGPDTIGNIEEKLKLSFVSEKEEDSNVCMANSPEVRDEYKDSFVAKDLLNYMYAVLHLPRYLEKYKDLSKIDILQVPYPNNLIRFWKLVGLGAHLRRLHPLESPAVEKYIDETNETLKKIAETEFKENF